MKTTFYFFAFCLMLQFNFSAQVNFNQDCCEPIVPQYEKSTRTLEPVYFSFSRRKLSYSGGVGINGKDFLNMCRTINDPQIRLQIARYDKLTNNKRKLLVAMVACGVGGYATMFAGLISASSYNGGGYALAGIGAAVFLIATPVLAISTSVPHQKRKEVVFRDLPDAYNFYVNTQNNK